MVPEVAHVVDAVTLRMKSGRKFVLNFSFREINTYLIKHLEKSQMSSYLNNLIKIETVCKVCGSDSVKTNTV